VQFYGENGVRFFVRTAVACFVREGGLSERLLGEKSSVVVSL